MDIYIYFLVTFEIEATGGRKRDLHEMRMIKLAISRKIVNNRDSSIRGLELILSWFSPDFGPFRAGFCVFPFLGQLQLGGRPCQP